MPARLILADAPSARDALTFAQRAARAGARGVDRTAEELGRAFPRVPVHASSAQHMLGSVPPGPSLVVATVGAEPATPDGYAAALRRLPPAERSAPLGLLDLDARAVMTPAPRTIAPGALAEAALAQMQERKITCLFAVEDGRPRGILHIHDCLRAGMV